MSTREFYNSGLGDNLINSSYYPKQIVEFLREEEKVVTSIADSIDLLVEVGCMHGRYLDWAVARKKKYLGLDVVPRYIEEGRRTVLERGLSADAYSFIHGRAEDIATLIKPDELQVEAERCLLFFPFNSFGNMADETPVIASLSRSQLPFLISSYRTDEYATAVRYDYYLRCGYQDISLLKSDEKIVFTSADGLNTVAYHPEHLTKVYLSHDLEVRVVPFASIGLAYMRGVFPNAEM